MFLLAEALFLMSRFDIIRVGWPVAFIAAGLEAFLSMGELRRREVKIERRYGSAFALILIVMGTLLFLDNLGVLPIRHIESYWPLALVVWGGLNHRAPAKRSCCYLGFNPDRSRDTSRPRQSAHSSRHGRHNLASAIDCFRSHDAGRTLRDGRAPSGRPRQRRHWGSSNRQTTSSATDWRNPS